MDFAILRTKLPAKIYGFFTNQMVYHSLAWVVLLIVFMLLEGMDNGFFFSLSNELINLLIYAIIVYFNLLYLIPNYLNNKRFFRYCLLLGMACLVITPLKGIIFFIKFYNFPSIRDNISENLPWYFITMFVVASCSTIFKIISDWKQHQNEHKELQTQTMQSELRFLKSQINPHFLFNTLNSLYALTLKKSDKAPEIVIKLSEMMRYMLYECNEKQVYLEKEVNYIRNYLDLEQLRHGKNVKISFEVEGQSRSLKIAPLMFIPFLENSFKHGVNNNLAQSFVNVKLRIKDQKIVFTIENSKTEALPSQVHKRSGGIGLVNVRRRLHIIYPHHHSLNIQESPRSYSVDLIIDLD